MLAATAVALLFAAAAAAPAVAQISPRPPSCSSNPECMQPDMIIPLTPGQCTTEDWICNASNQCENTGLPVQTPTNGWCSIDTQSNSGRVTCDAGGVCQCPLACQQNSWCGPFGNGCDCGFDVYRDCPLVSGPEWANLTFPGLACVGGSCTCVNDTCTAPDSCGRGAQQCGPLGASQCSCPGGTDCSRSDNAPGVCVNTTDQCADSGSRGQCFPGGVFPSYDNCLVWECLFTTVNVSCADGGCFPAPVRQCAPAPVAQWQTGCPSAEDYCLPSNGTCVPCPVFANNATCADFPGQCGVVQEPPQGGGGGGPAHPVETCPTFGNQNFLSCGCTELGAYCDYNQNVNGSNSGVCRVPCTPKTCDELSLLAGASKDCGRFADDGCGNPVNCSCPFEQFCSDAESVARCEEDCYNRTSGGGGGGNSTEQLCPNEINAFCFGGNNESSCQAVFTCDPSILPANETAVTACDTAGERAAWAAQCPNSTVGGNGTGTVQCFIGNTTVAAANDTACCLQQCNQYVPDTCNGPARDECNVTADCLSRWGGGPTPPCTHRTCAPDASAGGLRRCLELFTPNAPCTTPGAYPNGTSGSVAGLCVEFPPFLGSVRLCEPICVPGTCADISAREGNGEVCGVRDTLCTNHELACTCSNPTDVCTPNRVCEPLDAFNPPPSDCAVDADCAVEKQGPGSFGVVGKLPCRGYTCSVDHTGIMGYNRCVAGPVYPAGTSCRLIGPLGPFSDLSGRCSAPDGNCLGCATATELAATMAGWNATEWNNAGLASYTVLSVNVTVAPSPPPDLRPRFVIQIRMAGNLSTFNETLFNAQFAAASGNIQGSCTQLANWFSPPVFTSGSVIATTAVQDPGPTLTPPPSPTTGTTASPPSGGPSGSGSTTSLTVSAATPTIAAGLLLAILALAVLA